MANEVLDVITLGRAGVDLYGQQTGGRLEDVTSFAKYLGGCPANIAAGTSKLGLRSGIITRVGDDHMGRFLEEQFAHYGVSRDGIVSDKERLTALVILGIRDEDTFPLIFYRENCADMALCKEDIDPEFVKSSKALMISGTHLSKENVLDASLFAVACAKEAGRKVVFDIDYRPVLWGLTSKAEGENRFVANQEVSNRLQHVAAECDLIVGTEEEFHILGGTVDTRDALINIRALTDAELVLKLGPDGCVVFPDAIPDSLEDGIRGEGFKVEVFNVLGAGDGFLSGYLSGWLRDMPTTECCRRANACGAIVVSRHGCAPAMPTEAELEYFLSQEREPGEILADEWIEHIHWATSRPTKRDALYAFAIDHRSQMEDMARETGKGFEEILAAKKLAYTAFAKVAQNDRRYGMLLDGRMAPAPLAHLSGTDHWIGRPIELPGSRPLEFESSADVGMEIATWPKNHVVKCLVFYHPDDGSELRSEQEAQICRLYDACRKLGREFLLEVIASGNGPVTENTIATIIHRIYDLGVYPDWWKLEPASTDSEWVSICHTIESHDPFCRGIVMLGLSKPCDELEASFRAAAKFPLIKGFAVGRSIFDAPLRSWMKGEISDGEAIEKMSDNFQSLVSSWTSARQHQEPVLSAASVTS